ncbi:hypothetical protein ACFY2R_27835 [Micromonospora olivasterospora]|uniref:Uncharacterized protein n=1 Tax=Micromonospora olivasterospora TaxID=1880 RepID=A0A562IH45_MICOL|nr:hypothetical protein [Micromonospora olivasterospora]TWH70126.1 hypothetical protein JD77_05147 [Micromonospora olivasterospora]
MGRSWLRYEDNGWFGSYVDRSLTDYTHLVLRIRGERGGEESDIRLTLGGVRSGLTGLTLAGDNRTITTGCQDLRIPLAANRVNRTTPGELHLDFWHGGSSTVHAAGLGRVRTWSPAPVACEASTTRRAA